MDDSVPHLCGAYFLSLQTLFWADRFAKCLKMFHLTHFLYYKVWHFSSSTFIEKTAKKPFYAVLAFSPVGVATGTRSAADELAIK